jgi:DNA-binding IclR family transcriptional regulator
MMKKEKSAYNIQTVCHALDVLEQFHGDSDELGFTDLCKSLKFHKNKVFRLLATLESRNFIEQNKETTGYRLGLKNLQLGQTFVKQTGLIRQARTVLEALTGSCEETSYVAIMKDFQIIYLDAIESELPVRVASRVGKRLPFYCTAVGKVLAAGVDSQSLRAYFKNTELTRFTPNTITDPDELSKHLAMTAELGYAVDDEELNIGVKCVGAPIRDYTKRVVGALSVSAPSMRFTSERMNMHLIPLVKDAADQLSARLGYK